MLQLAASVHWASWMNSHKIKHEFTTEFWGKSGLQSWCTHSPDVFTSLDHTASWLSSFSSSGSAHLVPVLLNLCPCRRSTELLKPLWTNAKGELRKESGASDCLWTQCSPGKSELMSSGSAGTTGVQTPWEFRVALQWCGPQEKTLVGLALLRRGHSSKDKSWAQLSVPLPHTPCSSCNILWASDMAWFGLIHYSCQQFSEKYWNNFFYAPDRIWLKSIF